MDEHLPIVTRVKYSSSNNRQPQALLDQVKFKLIYKLVGCVQTFESKKTPKPWTLESWIQLKKYLQDGLIHHLLMLIFDELFGQSLWNVKFCADPALSLAKPNFFNEDLTWSRSTLPSLKHLDGEQQFLLWWLFLDSSGDLPVPNHFIHAGFYQKKLHFIVSEKASLKSATLSYNWILKNEFSRALTFLSSTLRHITLTGVVLDTTIQLIGKHCQLKSLKITRGTKVKFETESLVEFLVNHSSCLETLSMCLEHKYLVENDKIRSMYASNANREKILNTISQCEKLTALEINDVFLTNGPEVKSVTNLHLLFGLDENVVLESNCQRLSFVNQTFPNLTSLQLENCVLSKAQFFKYFPSLKDTLSIGILWFNDHVIPSEVLSVLLKTTKLKIYIPQRSGGQQVMQDLTSENHWISAMTHLEVEGAKLSLREITDVLLHCPKLVKASFKAEVITEINENEFIDAISKRGTLPVLKSLSLVSQSWSRETPKMTEKSLISIMKLSSMIDLESDHLIVTEDRFETHRELLSLADSKNKIGLLISCYFEEFFDVPDAAEENDVPEEH